MPSTVKLGVNCLIVAGLTLVGLFAYVSLPQFTLEPLQWAGERFDRPATGAFWFVYTALVWALFGTIVAWGMLFLKPRRVILYGCASAVAFVVGAQSWTLQAYGMAYLREVIFGLTIPLIYAAFVSLARRRRTTSSTSAEGSAGAA